MKKKEKCQIMKFYPKGSPTTKNAISTVSAPIKISSEELSTISLSAIMIVLP